MRERWLQETRAMALQSVYKTQLLEWCSATRHDGITTVLQSTKAMYEEEKE